MKKWGQSPIFRQPAECGFTLMELIIVLSIIGIMSAAVVPVFRGTFGQVERDHAVRDLVATIKYAQERAVTDTKEYRLYMNPEKNEYWLMRLDKVMRAKKTFEALQERQGESIFLPERLTLEKPTARKERGTGFFYVAFYPNGASDKATIKLTRNDGKPVTIETNGSLGQLKVDNGQPKPGAK